MAKLTEGQKLLWISHIQRNVPPREVTVTKVGRKWAQLDNHERIDIDRLVADGGGYSPPGRCYLNQEHYEESFVRAKAWLDFKNALASQHRVPEGVTAADIATARKLLGL